MTGAADQDWRALRSRAAGLQLALAGAVEPALEVDMAVLQQAVDDLDGFLEAAVFVVERISESIVLELLITILFVTARRALSPPRATQCQAHKKTPAPAWRGGSLLFACKEQRGNQRYTNS